MSDPKNLGQFRTLVNIVAKLRVPDGCPWDRQQTHASLRGHLLEECYEVLETIDKEDWSALGGELGDLLLQIVLHAQIAKEAGEFELADVLTGINTKLINRHPHVFGSVKADTVEEVLHNWETIKQAERGNASALDGVSRQLPALAYSQAVQHRVAQLGFDWKDIEGVIEKLVEEMEELKNAATEKEKAQEFGDLLFTLVNIARRMGIDSEAALRETNARFYRRFAYMENLCRQRGLTFTGLSFAEQNTLWEEAKKGTGKE
ncbi:MAG: nucleoside triphosphate pyrophosphohydrolase [Dehalococcoidales bacterium]|nr:nucleoside triphosphate pyrophosphohydrolase [Dehalococcoidales bacterium]